MSFNTDPSTQAQEASLVLKETGKSIFSFQE